MLYVIIQNIAIRFNENTERVYDIMQSDLPHCVQ